jgi:hypothetical protein
MAPDMAVPVTAAVGTEFVLIQIFDAVDPLLRCACRARGGKQSEEEKAHKACEKL